MADRQPNSDLAPVVMDEELRALQWATTRMPPGPQQAKASKARADLWDRIKADPFRPLTRDEERLNRRYDAIHDAYVADVVEAYSNR